MSKPETDKTTPAANPPPKAETRASIYANPFTPVFDFTPWMRDHADRIEQISDEIAAFEKQMIARWKTNAADMAALVQDTLDYMQQIGGEWRKIAIDTARRAADFTGKA